MLKFYPSRFRLFKDVLLSFLALAVLIFSGIIALDHASPLVVALGFGPFVLGFVVLFLVSSVWLFQRLPSLEASEEVFTIRRLWGQKIVVRWTEVAEIQQVIVRTGRREQKAGLVLRFITNSGRFEKPPEISQARLSKPLSEVISDLLNGTMARYVLTVQREPPAEWRQKMKPSWKTVLFFTLLLIVMSVGAYWYLVLAS